MANCRDFISCLKKNEGGYSNHPLDAGGETFQGITKSTYNLYKNDLKSDFLHLSDEDYYYIVKKGFWDVALCNYYKYQSVANMVCDFCFNSGATTALQSLNVHLYFFVKPLFEKYEKVSQCSMRFILKCNEIDEKELFANIFEKRVLFYATLIQKKESQKVFKKGWMLRLLRIWQDSYKVSSDEYKKKEQQLLSLLQKNQYPDKKFLFN